MFAYVNVIMNYNWISFFQRLPLDIQRLVFEYDDTYHRKFACSKFKIQLCNMYWKQAHIIQVVRELVYQRLEHLLRTNTFWNPVNGIFNTMGGQIFIARTFTEITNIREEIYIHVKPYKHYLRWKLIPSASNLDLYLLNEIQMVYDGFIGNQVDVHNEPKVFQSLFFKDGQMTGYGLQVFDVPKWAQHVGDTYWC